MTVPGPSSTGLAQVFLAKGSRVYVSGLLSIVIPFYLSVLKYDLFFQGIALVAILAGNAFSNIAVTLLDATFGKWRLLQAFSLLMIGSGILLAADSSPLTILFACFMGNISTTGAEAGPFQSIEAGVLPELAPPGVAVRVFGRYNLIGYSAAAAGTLTSSVPGVLGNGLWAFKAIFLAFSFVGLLLLLVYSRLGGIDAGPRPKLGTQTVGPAARKEIIWLSGLFSIDAFGGVFVSTYLLSTWFHVTYGLQLAALGPLFSVASVIAAASTYGAALIAERIGNLRTMVYTHLVSSTFLLLIAVAGSFLFAAAFLFLRQSFSQMDVPTRQALMTEMFQREERVPAYAVTNTVRALGAFGGGPVAAGILASGFLSGILLVGGGTKVFYDLLIFLRYRKRFR
ncbi:MAG: MFS transporter [Thaumarchaeota archaeon]|nr:MFS transporter [Nitrososphaerota archaeon]